MLKITLCLFGFGLFYVEANNRNVYLTKPIFKIEHAHYYFRDFMTTYNKQYQSETEKQYRLKVFTENINKINKMNVADTAVFDVNKFSDLTTEEFLGMYTGFRNISNKLGAVCDEVQQGDLKTYKSPDAFDWRDKNVVSPIKNQLNCGSCYAFSSVANIESLYAMKNGKILDLSEQELVDCSKYNSGCDGGKMTQCMIDVMDLGGITSEESYPYEHVRGECRFQPDKEKITISGCKHFNINDENRLKDVLFENGPICIALAADAFHSYNGGILKNCPGEVNHAVLLVGYGSGKHLATSSAYYLKYCFKYYADEVAGRNYYFINSFLFLQFYVPFFINAMKIYDESGTDFWIIKNSYGTSWGEQGYIRIERGSNTCQLLDQLIASAVI